MATVNLGSIKFKWKGTYAGGTAYTIDDVVSYNGSSYICIQASTGNLPTNATYFEQMSSAGTNGSNGTDVGTTITTQGDILYRDGSGLQRLGAGTSGQILQTGGTGANPSWTDAPSGVIKKIHHFTRSTRSAPNNSVANKFTWTSSFTPLDATNNSFYVSGTVPINSAGNNYSAYGLRFGSSLDFQSQGSVYGDLNTGEMGTQSYFFVIGAGVLSQATVEINHREYTVDSQPNAYFPNSSDDARLNVQTEGHLTIFEYKN